MARTNETPLELLISMSVLEDLGINLYGNVPAVLSEVVANAWDADAHQVNIAYDKLRGEITIVDDGIGMTREEMQKYYLTVGHKRRREGRTETPSGRTPMGRKGIGKLSLFSIAEKVKVETIKDGEKTAMLMEVDAIKRSITKAPDGRSRYHPKEVRGNWNFSKGTRITLLDLRKERVVFERGLRRRLARRFFMIGQEAGFEVRISDEKLTIGDRGYLGLVEYLWTIGTDSDWKEASELGKGASNVERVDRLPDEPEVRGWIGTAHRSQDLTREGNNANNVVLIVRGKMACPDLLASFGVRELASKYILGEVHADFMDDDELEDVATSDRQGFLEEDERYKRLVSALKRVIQRVISDRARLKRDEAERAAISLIPELEQWLESLSRDRREAARKLFGSINNIYEDEEEKRREHFKQAIVAHQIFDARGRLRELEDLAARDAEAVLQAFSEFDQYEAALYYDVAKVRVDVIRTLEDKFLSKNSLEAVIRDYLAKHLWLLDPSWDMATEPVATEKTVKGYLERAADALPRAERDARFDIVYRKGTTRHVVVELKRYKRKVTVGELVDQIGKYSSALQSALTDVNEPYDTHEIVCLVGPGQDFLKSPEARKKADQTLAPHSGRLMTYDEMLDRAKKSYRDFLRSEERRNQLVKLLASIAPGASRAEREVDGRVAVSLGS